MKNSFAQILTAILVIFAFQTSATAQRPAENPQIKLPALLLPKPVLEWKKFETDVKLGSKTVTRVTYGFANWQKFSDVSFAPSSANPACSTAPPDSRTILDFYDYQTDNLVFTDCSPEKQNLKENAFWLLPQNTLPVCVYAVMTDRESKLQVKSNPIDIHGAKYCYKLNATKAPTKPKQ